MKPLLLNHGELVELKVIVAGRVGNVTAIGRIQGVSRLIQSDFKDRSLFIRGVFLPNLSLILLICSGLLSLISHWLLAKDRRATRKMRSDTAATADIVIAEYGKLLEFLQATKGRSGSSRAAPGTELRIDANGSHTAR